MSTSLLLALALAAPVARADDPAPTAIRRCTESGKALPTGIEEAKKRTVRIETMLGTGSGVVVSGDGFVLTAAHVVGTADKVKVVLVDGSSVEGAVVRANPTADLALVRLPKGGLPCAPLATSRLGIGHEVYLVGSPTGSALTHSVSKGIVSAWRDVDGVPVLQTDASVNGGNSGGPVFDTSGTVQGVVSFKAVGQGIEGLGFAVGAEEVAEALRVTWGASTAAEVAVWRKATGGLGGRGNGKATPPTIEGRPAAPAPVVTKNACKKAEAESKVDPFSGARTVKIKEDGQFELNWEAGGAPRVTVIFSAAAFGAVASGVQTDAFRRPGAVKADVALLDGTKIHFTSQSAELRAGFWGINLAVELGADEASIAALASSPPVLWRWRVDDGAPNDAAKSTGDQARWLPAFACLALEMGLVPAP